MQYIHNFIPECLGYEKLNIRTRNTEQIYIQGFNPLSPARDTRHMGQTLSSLIKLPAIKSILFETNLPAPTYFLVY